MVGVKIAGGHLSVGFGEWCRFSVAEEEGSRLTTAPRALPTNIFSVLFSKRPLCAPQVDTVSMISLVAGLADATRFRHVAVRKVAAIACRRHRHRLFVSHPTAAL